MPRDPDRSERVARGTSALESEMLTRRSDAFSRALNRKGLPVTWGTGVPRSDSAWKQDRKYLIEDHGKWPPDGPIGT